MTKEQVAVLIKDKRHECNMTGDEVVKKLQGYGIKISPKTLWGYETCASAVPVPTFLALCQIYGIQDAIGETKAKQPAAAMTADEKKLLSYYRAASPELKEAALRMLQPVEKGNTASLVG